MNHPAMNHPAMKPAASPSAIDSSIGGLLLASGKLSPENAERVLRLQQEEGIRFGEAAQRLGLISEADIQQVLARQFDYPYLTPGDGNLSPQLVAAYHPFSPQVEVLRAVRSQLMLRWFGRGRKALAVAAVEPGDGGSLFAANLAVVFSQLGEQTLLVDANLRTPRQQDIFGIKQRAGLSDVLAGRAETDVVEKVDQLVDLSVLVSGTLPPNPQELLARPAFAGLNLQFESRYDVVLYDTPACVLGSDTLALASRVGGVLLVARKNRTSLAAISACVDQLQHAGIAVVGSVMVEH